MSITTSTPATTVQTPLQGPVGNAQSIWLLSVALTPASVAANTSAEQSFTVAGIQAGDLIEVNKPTVQAGLGIVNSRAAANTIYIGFSNNTASPITPTAGEAYQIVVMRPIAQDVTNGLPSSLPTP